jgi:beta-lactamase class A
MGADVHAIVLGDRLSSYSRRTVAAWLKGSVTGGALLRAGLPSSWKVGDKTGLGGAQNAHGDSDTRNDVAIAWPPAGGAIVIAAYLTGSTLAATPRDAILASIARTIAPVLAA